MASIFGKLSAVLFLKGRLELRGPRTIRKFCRTGNVGTVDGKYFADGAKSWRFFACSFQHPSLGVAWQVAARDKLQYTATQQWWIDYVTGSSEVEHGLLGGLPTI